MQQEYEIEVQTDAGLKPLVVNVINSDTNIKYEIWDAGQHIFSLECCTDQVGDTLKLTKEFIGKSIDPKLVQAVADIIQSEEE